LEKRYRPDGITAIAVVDFLWGIAFVLLSVYNLTYAPLNIPLLFIGLVIIGIGYGTWIGMTWAWYLLTFGGGFFGWYFARNDVKDYFGIEDNVN
jgi:hypothetical protein